MHIELNSTSRDSCCVEECFCSSSARQSGNRVVIKT